MLPGALLGALLLLVSQFTTLYQVHIAARTTPIESIGAGSNHAYALVPIAVLAALLGVGVARTGSRSALLAVGALGLVALLIALIVDLPDARASGLVGSASTHYTNATSTASAGLYMETLGAIVLIAVCGSGFLVLGLPRRRPPRAAAD